MGSYDIHTLRMARSGALELAEAGLGAGDARAELARRGLDSGLANLALAIVAAEQRRRAERGLRAGLVLGGLAVAVALLGLLATATAPTRDSLAGPLLTVLGSGGALMLGALVRRLLRPGWPVVPGALDGLGVSLDELRSDEEVLNEATAQHQRRRRIEIIAAIAAIALAFFGAVLVLPATGGVSELGFFVLLGIGASLYALLRLILLGAEGMTAPSRPPGAPPTVPPVASPGASPSAAPVPLGRDHAVPRLPAATLPRDADIPHAPLLRPGALSVDFRVDGQSAHAGLLVFTTLGLAYLPDMQNQLLTAANMIVPRVISYAVPEGVAQLLAFVDELAGPGLTPQAWAQRASADPRHAVIPWPELVRVRYLPRSLSWVVTRQLPDGTGRDLHLELVGEDDLALLLFSARLRFECDVVTARLLAPERDRISTEERTKAADYYGAEVAEHAAEIEARIARRLAAWLDTRRGEVTEAVRAELGPALPAYAAIPGLASLRPELFEAGASAK